MKIHTIFTKNSMPTFKIVLSMAFLLLCILNANAQVFTRIINKKSSIEEYLPWYFKQGPPPITLPVFNVEDTIAKDIRNNVLTNRYAVMARVNLNKKDGVLYKFGNYVVWKLKIESKYAKSLNFNFSNLLLPEGSQLFLYSGDNQMIQGPIVAKDVHNGNFNSDIIYGENVTIELYLPGKTSEEFSLEVKNVLHGIERPEAGSRAFGDALSCNINTICADGDDFRNEIESVCLLLLGVGSCTGTLMNNECNDFTPFCSNCGSLPR